MIRLGTITRDEGIRLVKKYDGKCSEKYIKSFCEYIEISPKYFWEKVHSVTNKELFDIKNNKIIPKFKVGSKDAL